MRTLVRLEALGSANPLINVKSNSSGWFESVFGSNSSRLNPGLHEKDGVRTLARDGVMRNNNLLINLETNSFGWFQSVLGCNSSRLKPGLHGFLE